MESELGNWVLANIVFGLLGWYAYQVGVLEPKRKKEQWLKDQIAKTGENKPYWDEWDKGH